MLIPETGRVTEPLRVREIDDDEGLRLVRIVRRGGGWEVAPAQGMDAAAIANVAFTSEDRVRDTAALNAGLAQVNHSGHPHYFMPPGGQVFTLARANRV